MTIETPGPPSGYTMELAANGATAPPPIIPHQPPLRKAVESTRKSSTGFARRSSAAPGGRKGSSTKLDRTARHQHIIPEWGKTAVEVGCSCHPFQLPGVGSPRKLYYSLPIPRPIKPVHSVAPHRSPLCPQHSQSLWSLLHLLRSPAKCPDTDQVGSSFCRLSGGLEYFAFSSEDRVGGATFLVVPLPPFPCGTVPCLPACLCHHLIMPVLPSPHQSFCAPASSMLSGPYARPAILWRPSVPRKAQSAPRCCTLVLALTVPIPCHEPHLACLW